MVTGDEEGQVHIWSDDQKIKTMKVHDKAVNRMCSLKQDKIFTASVDGTIKVLGPNFEKVCEMEGSKRCMPAIADYENTVATGNAAGVIYNYDLDSASEPRVSFCQFRVYSFSDFKWSFEMD